MEWVFFKGGREGGRGGDSLKEVINEATIMISRSITHSFGRAAYLKDTLRTWKRVTYPEWGRTGFCFPGFDSDRM